MARCPIDTSNYRKFQTRNPVARWLIARFYNRLSDIVRSIQPSSVLDAGCGEGETIDRLGKLLPDSVVGFDVNPACVSFVSGRFPDLSFSVQSIYELPYEPDSFDLVMCLEVLEHLDKPELALRELVRVARKDLLLSVPYEPYFTIGSLLRGKDITRLGSTPEHLQHWNKKRFRRFLAGTIEDVNVASAKPWLIAQCRKHTAVD